MKVKDLINELKNLPEDSEIFFKEYDDEEIIREIDSIRFVCVGRIYKNAIKYRELDVYEIEDFKNDPDDVVFYGPPIYGFCIE